jgi:hypothetical protein
MATKKQEKKTEDNLTAAVSDELLSGYLTNAADFFYTEDLANGSDDASRVQPNARAAKAGRAR